jgi:hypothetical protein
MKRTRKFLDKWGHYTYLAAAALGLHTKDYTMLSLMLSMFLLEITTRLDKNDQDNHSSDL